jgi:hypothetical protein
MNIIKQRILTGWNFQRIIYIAAGTIFLVNGIVARQWPAIFVGGYFVLMGLFAFGCAAGTCFNGAYNKSETENISKSEEINFEEIK